MRSRIAALERASGGTRTPWTAPTLLNSWVNYGSGFQDCQYRRVGDMVQVRGLIKSGTIAVIFNLPAGFRPPAFAIFQQECNPTKSCRIDVYGNGNVTLVAYDAGGGNGYVSLDGISFSVTA
jgi:hypothetical protein